MNKKAFLASFFLAVFLSRIFTFNSGHKIIGDGYDNYEYFGFQHLVKENIQNLKYPLAQTNTLRYPVGFDFGYGYDGVLAVFTGAGLGLILPQPLAYNLSIIIILTLNVYLSFLLFNKLSNKFHWGFLGAIIYGLSPYVFARINSHLNLAFIGGFPFFVYALTVNSLPLILTAILLIAFGSLQYLVIFSELIFIGLTIGLLVPSWRKEILQKVKNIFNKSSSTKIILSLILFLGIFLFFFGGYLKAIINGSFIFKDKSDIIRQYGRPSISDYFIPNQYLGNFWSNFNHSAKSIEKVVGLGIVESIIFILLLPKSKKKNAVLLLGGFVLLTLFGANWLKLPFVPEGGRLIIIFALILTTFLTYRKPIKNKKIIWGLILLLILERFSYRIYTSPLFSQEAAKIIQNQPGKAVLNIPVSKYNPYYSTLPYFYDKKITSGYFHYSADTPETSRFIEKSEIIRFICQDENQRKKDILFSSGDKDKIINLLKENNIQTIVVHKKLENLHKFYHDECQNVRYSWFNLKPRQLTLDKSTDQLQTKTIQLANQPNLKLDIFSPHQGTLSLHGILIYPDSLNQTVIVLPNNKTISPQWQVNPHGLNISFDPIQKFDMNPGESIYLYSPQKVNEPIYITLYYHYQVTNDSLRVSPDIEEIYRDDNIEVYTLN
jgi:hypothetical protein